jgi:hypothetical protein
MQWINNTLLKPSDVAPIRNHVAPLHLPMPGIGMMTLIVWHVWFDPFWRSPRAPHFLISTTLTRPVII